jgi:hypothetical protein
MLTTSRILAFFARVKHGRALQKKSKTSIQEEVENLYNIDDNYNYLDGLSQISIVDL